MTSMFRTGIKAACLVLGLGCAQLGAAAPSASLHKFRSDEAFAKYMKTLEEYLIRTGQLSANPDEEQGEGQVGQEQQPAMEEAGNETITNNQEEGADEGGIVKNIGDYLVVLRKGRLYAMSVSSQGAPRQTDAIRVASSPELNEDVWYDEMLVKGDLIYVIGYRYGLKTGERGGQEEQYAAATEVNSFRLKKGKLTRLKTSFFESNDYFSMSNYASRMVDGAIVLYMPFAGFKWWQQHYVPNLPRIFSHEGGGRFSVAGDLLAATDVYVPYELPQDPTFHVVVRCALPQDGSIDCNAKAALGQWGREHYVSSDRIYVWTDPAVYAFNLKDEWAGVHRVKGSPANQFSFKQSGDTLRVLATMTQGENDDDNQLRLYTLKLKDFGASASQALNQGNTRVLLKSKDYIDVMVNRFVDDDHVMAALYDDERSTTLLNYDIATRTINCPKLPGVVERIERLGNGMALVASATGKDLADMRLDVLSVGSQVFPLAAQLFQGLGQGESRSHGFFYKPDPQGGGVFGLAVVNGSEDSAQGWGDGVANIMFESVSPRGALRNLGIAASSPSATSVCETSCIDWYGNTRPIFLKDRIFGLMGSELVELGITSGRIKPLGTRAFLQ